MSNRYALWVRSPSLHLDASCIRTACSCETNIVANCHRKHVMGHVSDEQQASTADSFSQQQGRDAATDGLQGDAEADPRASSPNPERVTQVSKSCEPAAGQSCEHECIRVKLVMCLHSATCECSTLGSWHPRRNKHEPLRDPR